MAISKFDSKRPPLVSIGIPTYNRAALLKRAIESALNQDYVNIEVIVSDNASTDDTESICRSYSEKDARLKYIRQSSNRGPVANFAEVLKNASGQFFMWLGDDDWIDLTYVSTCVQQLMSDPTMALVSGAPQYYRNGQKTHEGKIFSLLQDKWWQRVIVYYNNVTDNGMFYGVMHTAHIQKIKIPTVMGGDWLLLANIVSLGKAKVIPETSVHRELGGATMSYQKIASGLGLPKMHAMFPMISIASSAWLDIVVKGVAIKSRPVFVRLMVGAIVFLVIMSKNKIVYFVTVARSCLKRLSLIKA
jgi:Glycosyl transferase family 2